MPDRIMAFLSPPHRSIDKLTMKRISAMDGASHSKTDAA
jgi:hypothetical protein